MMDDYDGNEEDALD